MHSQLFLSSLMAVAAMAAPSPLANIKRQNGLADLAKQIVEAHNTRRSCCGASAIEWDDSIASMAQSYADGCPKGHSGTKGYGENLYWTSATGGDIAVAALKAWTEDEYGQYTGAFSEGAGHFSQVVWKGSSKVGCGWQPTCGDGMGTFVCNYQSPGNVQGQFPQNVGTCDFSQIGSSATNSGSTGSNSGSNSGSYTGSNPGSNTSFNSGSNSGSNYGSNTGSNSNGYRTGKVTIKRPTSNMSSGLDTSYGSGSGSDSDSGNNVNSGNYINVVNNKASNNSNANDEDVSETQPTSNDMSSGSTGTSGTSFTSGDAAAIASQLAGAPTASKWYSYGKRYLHSHKH